MALNPDAPAFFPHLGFIPVTTNPFRTGNVYQAGTGQRLEYTTNLTRPGLGYTPPVSRPLNAAQRPMAEAGAAALAGLASSAVSTGGSILGDILKFITADKDRPIEQEKNRLTQQSIENEKTFRTRELDQSQQQITNSFWLGKSGLEIDRMNAETNSFTAHVAANQLDRNWEAARNLGLYSIDQLGAASNTAIYRSNGFTPQFARTQRNTGNSPFGTTF